MTLYILTLVDEHGSVEGIKGFTDMTAAQREMRTQYDKVLCDHGWSDGVAKCHYCVQTAWIQVDDLQTYSWEISAIDVEITI